MLVCTGRGVYRAHSHHRRVGCSIEWARERHAKSWELRSSTTLAELLAGRGQREGARESLGPIYKWLSEGVDTHDLKVAHQLLDSLRRLSDSKRR